MKTFRPFVFITGLIVIVGLACGLGAPTQEPAAPIQPPIEPAPTLAQQEPPAPIEQPTESAPPPVAGGFFTEEFNSDPGWYYEIVKGRDSSDDRKAKYTFDAGRMIFDIEDPALFAYYMFRGDTYEDVRLDIKVENRGVNSQQVSLICRESDDGWYELAIQSDGTWVLYAVENGFNVVTNGGSNHIKQGKDVNEYTMICSGNEISFFFNGVEHRSSPFAERKYAFRRGNVGFSVSSLRATPVKIEVDWFKVSQP